jgi:hypothetical protein
MGILMGERALEETMATEEEKRAAVTKARAHIQAAAVTFADPVKSGMAAQLEAETVDDAWVTVSRYHRFCVNSSTPWLGELWLWLAVRCWKQGKVAREDLPDPREGLPPETKADVMDQVASVAKGQWSPSQAAIIRKALRGEMPMSLWNLQNAWRASLLQKQDAPNPDAGKVLVEEDGKVRTTERAEPPELPPVGAVMIDPDQAPKPKKRIRVKVRRPKPRKKKGK